jgi:hypothetical protein
MQSLPIPETRPIVDHTAGPIRRLRKRAGATLEYLWELSGSLRLARADALLIRGREKETGLPLTTAYFGHYGSHAFVLKRIYEEFETVERHEGVHSLRGPRWIARWSDRASLLFADVELLYDRPFRRASFLQIPQWIRQKYEMPGTWSEVLGSFRKNTKKTDLRRVRKYGLTYVITRREKDFDDFYHRMYVPYLRMRFGDEAIIEPEAKVRRQYHKGALMHVLREGEVVAAVLLHMLEGRLAYVWVGVPDGLPADLFRGAFSAMYYFTILHGYLQGCHEVDFLGSRPLLNDGLFRYKRKWGTRIEISPVPRGNILLRPQRLDEPLQHVFARSPFIVLANGGLTGKMLWRGTPATERDLGEMYDRHFTPGLDHLKVYSLAGFTAGARAWAESAGLPVRIVDLSTAADPAGVFCRS